jgi:4'-phosphopantetheinyl transferase
MTVSVLITSEFSLSPALEAQWLASLPPPRRMQIGAWPDTPSRHRSLLGSRLLTLGMRRLGYGDDALATLRYPTNSRPTLALPVSFSLSHCDGRIVCALSTQGAVGIDVEALGGLIAGDFHLYLSAAERAWAGRSTRRFYSVWTRKEAVAKAASQRGLRDVEVPGLDESRHLSVEEREQQRADVAAVHVGVRHDDDAVVPQPREVEVAAHAAAAGDDRFDYPDGGANFPYRASASR